MPTIAIANQSTVLTDEQIKPVVDAIQIQVDRDFSPLWGIWASLLFLPKGGVPSPEDWLLRIVDNPDVLGALGDHTLTETFQPLGNVFAALDIESKSSWSVTISHEVLEMLADPFLINTVIGPDGNPWALEVSDMVESDGFGYKIGDVLVSDFVCPAGFGAAGAKWDFLGNMTSPFQILAGGYISVFKDGKWTQIDAERKPGGPVPPRGSRRKRRVPSS